MTINVSSLLLESLTAGQLADELDEVLGAAGTLEPHTPRRLPLLDALHELDQREGADRARRLMIIGAVIHDEADERLTAEYLLRHRHELRNGRPVTSLISAARFAAEMEFRRSRSREMAVETLELSDVSHEASTCSDSPAVGEIVVDFLEGATIMRLRHDVADHVRNAVTMAMELADRHTLNGGAAPALIAMRPSARPAARLVCQLRSMLPAAGARCLSRVLVGSDGTDLATAAMWWAATSTGGHRYVPPLIRSRWTRDLQLVDATTTPAHQPARSAA